MPKPFIELPIQHVIPISLKYINSPQSIFQGFTKSVIDDFDPILDKIINAPFCVADLLAQEHGKLISRKLSCFHSIDMMRVDLFCAEYFTPQNSAYVFWSTPNTINDVQSIIERYIEDKIISIHITTKKSPSCGAIHIDDVDENTFKKWVSNIFKKFVKNADDDPTAKETLNFIESKNLIKNLKLNNRIGHNCTKPLLALLENLHYDIRDIEPLPSTEDSSVHESAMLTLHKVLYNECEELLTHEGFKNNKNDAIIYTPSMFHFLYDKNCFFWKGIAKKLSNRDLDFLKKATIENQNYSNFSYENLSKKQIQRVLPIIAERSSELRHFAKLISIFSVGNFAPAFRFPNSVANNRRELKKISKQLCSTHLNPVEISSTINELNEKYHTCISKDILSEMLDKYQKITIVSDSPLEWLIYKNTPLMFSHEISRLPSTPGNLLQHNLLSSVNLELTVKQLNNILIIRSFKNDDVIKFQLEKAIDVFTQENLYRDLSISIVDITTKEELISTLNDYNGFIVIFDCHGTPGGELNNGELIIGNEQVDTWSLANIARLPPIVLLSACSTHAINGSHASVANGFLRSGALSVLGTLAPVESSHSAILISRIIYRISHFLPGRVNIDKITWRNFISNFFKMSYATDIIKGLFDNEKIISLDEYQKINTETNILINIHEDPDWRNKMIENICSISGRDRGMIEELILERYSFVESMLYTHLGRPETITIKK